MVGAGAAAATAAPAPVGSMQCNSCGVLVQSFEAALAHATRNISHINFTVSADAVRSIVCFTCGVRCGSERVADQHSNKTNHKEFVVKKPAVANKDVDASTSEEKKGVDVLDEKVLALLQMGYSEPQALRAIIVCGDTTTTEELVAWLVKCQHDTDIDRRPVVADQHSNKTKHKEFVIKKPAVADKEVDASTSEEKKGVDVLDEKILALLQMGYSEPQALRAINVCGDTATTEELVAWLVNCQHDTDIDRRPVVPFETMNINLVSEDMKSHSANLRRHLILKLSPQFVVLLKEGAGKKNGGEGT